MLHKQIKEKRIQMGLTQIDAARRLRIEPSELCNIESGKRPITYSRYKRFKKLFNITIPFGKKIKTFLVNGVTPGIQIPDYIVKELNLKKGNFLTVYLINDKIILEKDVNDDKE